MLPLRLTASSEGGLLSLLVIGAHPDDIEIGAGGTLLDMAESQPGLRVHYLLVTGSPDRQVEARHAASEFLPGADLSIELHDLPEGRLPARWARVKDLLEEVAGSYTPDLIIAPQPDDAHQDHRTIAEILPTVFRDQLTLGYEIPKWDGDLGRPAMYFPMSADEEVFRGLARLRGMECRAPYAEAFSCAKSVVRSQLRDSEQPRK